MCLKKTTKYSKCGHEEDEIKRCLGGTNPCDPPPRSSTKTIDARCPNCVTERKEKKEQENNAHLAYRDELRDNTYEWAKAEFGTDPREEAKAMKLQDERREKDEEAKAKAEGAYVSHGDGKNILNPR
jgi:hypothetical protein